MSGVSNPGALRAPLISMIRRSRSHYIWGPVRRVEGDYNKDMTTEALRVHLDNLQCEIQSLQVENRNLRAARERNQGEESQVALEASALNTEIEELRQRLMEAEERAINFEQEAEQWKTTVEQVQKEAQEREANLRKQLEEKAQWVEELINKGNEHQLEIDKLHNEHQLEIDKLCAENKTLKERTHGESQLAHSIPRSSEQTCAYEASLRSVTGSSESSLDGLSPPSFTLATVVNSQGITSSTSVGELPVLSSVPTLTSVPVTWRSSVGLNAAAQPFNLLYSTRSTNSPHSAVYHSQVLNSGSQVHHRTIEQPMGAAPSALYGIQYPQSVSTVGMLI